MIDIGLFEKFVRGLEKWQPGLVRHVKERAVLARALGGYRTPSNHHLRRALRLSWVRAASTVIDYRGVWARQNPAGEGAADLIAFMAVFDGARNEVISAACATETGADLGESPIDLFLDDILKDLGQHFIDGTPGTGRNAVRANFGKTLIALTGVEGGVPSRILADAADGFSIDGGEVRDFGQLMFDEFSQILQNPEYYPEAGNSVPAALAEIHQRANTALLGNIRSEIADVARTLPADVRAQVEQALANFEPDFFRDALLDLKTGMERDFGIIKDKLDEMHAGLSVRPPEISGTARTDDQHRAARPRTLMLAGSRSNREVSRALDEFADLISVSVLRSGEKHAIVPLPWNFAESIAREEPEGEYARTGAWATIDSNIVGGVLVLGDSLGKDIEPDDRFLAEAERKGWLAGDVRFDDLRQLRSTERIQELRKGAVPITYETRFAVECLIRDKPLLVVMAPGRDALQPAVQNLLGFLAAAQVTVFRRDEAAPTAEHIGPFTTLLLPPERPALPNPYRGLDFYTVEDGTAFEGRKPEAAQAHAHVAGAVERGRGLFLGVSGPSGCGKSSFMRAKVAADVRSTLGLVPIEFRPTDFRPAEGVKMRPLPLLCDALATALGVEPPAELVGEFALGRRLHLPKFKDWLAARLPASDKPRFIVCLDQFEEILDDLSERVHDEEWRALIEMLVHLANRHGCPLIFTLEDTRRGRFERFAKELGLDGAKFVALSDQDDDFFRDIIRRPFAQIGIDLDSTIVDALISEVNEHRASVSSSSSPLPLLSLRLETLFREVSPKAPLRAQGSQRVREFSRVLVRRSELADPSLGLGAMIGDLADAAWRVGRGGDEIYDVGAFLRPLIRVSIDPDDPDDAKLVLLTVGGRGWRDEQRLEAEFRRRRLLVPSAGGVRIVHEAVIRRWPRANEWYEGQRGSLLREGQFRSDAMRWAEADKPPLDKMDDAQIELAASLLGGHTRDWSPIKLPPLDAETLALRAYAIAVFETSRGPMTRFIGNGVPRAHINLAATYGRNELLNTFLSIDPKSIESRVWREGCTPLMCAAWAHPDTVRLLLDAGANANATDTRGFSAIDCAVWGRQDEIADIVLKHVDAAKWDEKRVNPLSGAAAMGRLDIAEKLVAHGFRHDQPAAEGWTPLHAAATQSDLGVFKYFVERGNLLSRWGGVPYGPDAQRSTDQTPFCIAAGNGHTELVRYLLSREDAADALEFAADTGETPLTSAARYHWYETVAVLVSAMTDPNGRTNLPYADGFTALHHALAVYADERTKSSGHLKRVTTQTVLALLASPKVDVAAKTAIGATAWQMAIGLPDVQRAIERHQTFTEASRDEVRQRLRAFPLKERQDKLIDAVESRNVDLFDAGLDDFLPGEVLDGKRDVAGETLSLGEFMIKAGWIDRLSELIVSGRLDPWRGAEDYDGLLVQAHMAGATSLFKLVRECMPATISATIARTMFYRPAKADGVALDPDRTMTQAFLERMPRSELDPTLFAASKRGDRQLFEQAVRAGANPAALDDWGRTLTQVGPGPDGMAAGEDLFWPGASGWSMVHDVDLRNLLKGSRQIAKMAWDELIDVKWREVPYYPGAKLIVVTHPNWRPANRALYWLHKGEKLYHLDGTSPPIHQFNADNGLTITAETALDYLRFFCFFVRSEGGPFYVVASDDAPYLPDIMRKDSAAPERRERFASVFQPPRAYGTTKDGHQRISVMCYYSNALFASDTCIHSTGMVEMVDDVAILEDLPATIDAPI